MGANFETEFGLHKGHERTKGEGAAFPPILHVAHISLGRREELSSEHCLIRTLRGQLLALSSYLGVLYAP